MYHSDMERLNYHHLFYFWVVAKEGTIAAACKELQVAQPTISTQLRALEDAIGRKLFVRAGRHLVLTDTGRTVYRYADGIFALGQELMGTLESGHDESRERINVGIADVLPKLVAHRLLEPISNLDDPVRLVCHEAPATELLGRLATRELDLVLSDSPIGSEVSLRAFSHLLGKCGVLIMGTKDLATARRRREFPSSLDGAPFLLPTTNTTLRGGLERWFEAENIHPMVVAEIEDSALLKAFGQAGAGLFAVPAVVEQEVMRQYGVRVVGNAPSVEERFFAITTEKKPKHRAVAAIVDAARQRFSGN
jgi:LysR family transcriptional activator of nhaA